MNREMYGEGTGKRRSWPQAWPGTFAKPIPKGFFVEYGRFKSVYPSKTDPIGKLLP